MSGRGVYLGRQGGGYSGIGDGQPAGVVEAFLIEALGDFFRVCAVGVHDPEGRDASGLCAAEGDLLAVGGFGDAEVPDFFLGGNEVGDGFGCGIEQSDTDATARGFGFVIAVEVVEIGLADAVLPGDDGSRKAAGEEDFSVTRPLKKIGTGSAGFGGAVGGGEPHLHTGGESAIFGAIAFADADIGSVVTGIGGGNAIGVEEPLIIGRPTGSEEEMAGFGLDELTMVALKIAGPDLITLGRGEVVGDAFAIVAEAEAVGETFAGSGEITGVCAVEIHADDATDAILDDLHEEAIFADEEGGGFEGGDAVFGADFLKGACFEIVDPGVGGSLGVVFVEGFSGAVAARFHAEEEDAVSIREEGTGLPGGLIGDVEIEGAEAGAVGVNEVSFPL